MATSADQKTKRLYEFGPFRVDPEKELLLRDDETVPLAPKAFQVLLVLISHKKEVVTKDELLKTVWPDTFVEEANLSRNVFLLRKALGESPQDHQYIVTVPGRGYRFTEEVQFVPEQELNIVAASHSTVQLQVKETRPWGWIALAAVLLVALAFGAYKLFIHRWPVLTEKDTVVLADFVNNTGDPVFDGTLRQGLAIQLEQSPFLSLISDQQIQQTLQYMGQPSDARLTPTIAHEVCQRTQSAAYLIGSIARLGGRYVIGLKAVSCPTGDVLAEEQETVTGEERVLEALDKSAGKLRERLGESLSTVEKFNTPLEQATTPSLEALKAYTMGRRIWSGKNEFAAAAPFYQRAIELDPNFALAHAALGTAYFSTGETVLGAESARRAYELHVPISGAERFYVESTYYCYVLGDLEKAHQVYFIWAQTYPRSSSARIRLWELYSEEGKYEDALPQIREAVRLDPWKGLSFQNLVGNLIDLNRFEEADTTAQQAIANQRDSPPLHIKLYQLAFWENDLPGMARQIRSVDGDPDFEGQMLEQEADTAAYGGHLKESRNLSRSAVESATRGHKKETATSFQANAALREALYGNVTEVSSLATSALAIPTGRSVLYATALSRAIAGDGTRAQSLADDLARQYPDDTLVQFNFLPAIRAQIALSRHDPSKAIDLLQSAGPYALSNVWWGFLGPIYVRGEAYLKAHRGIEAAAEFQKILDHPGIVANSPSGALAHLQLGRACALSGDKNKARIAYQQFLTLWKDADPDIPILQQAKLEYARLQ
jgi:DNA-binding winged helix-turn-helix (wHTH) protein/Tfp pilus assembly protein PilF